LRTKGVLLDLDGTIVDSTEAYLEAAKTAFHAIGQTLPTHETALEIPKRLEQGFPMSDLTNGFSKKFLSVYLKTYYSITREKTKLIPNVTSALEALSKKNKLALITMRKVPKQAIMKELEFFGISKYFAYFATAMDSFKPKPSPEAVLTCLAALDLKNSDCIIAGDSVNDVRAGKAACVMTVAVLSGLYNSEELSKEKPDFILNDVTALSDLIE